VSDNITVAFAGPADVTPEAVKALLNDYLGFGPDDADGYPAPSDREIELVFPIREDHLSPGLENVLAWSADVDLPYTAVVDPTEKHKGAAGDYIGDAAEVIKATNVNSKIVDILSHAKGEGVLVLLWGEGEDAGDEDTEVLLDLALAENIKVVDLTAGLDDMTFAEEEPEEEVVPEPEPEPAPARRPRGAARKAAVRDRKTAEPEVATEPEKPARRGRSRKAEEPLVQEEVPLDDEGNDTTETADEAISAIEEEVAALADTAIAKRAAKKSAKATDAAAEEDVIISNGVIAGRPPVFDSLDLIKGTLSSVWLYLQSEVENDALLMLDEKVEESPLAEAVREALEALEGVATVTKEARVDMPKRGRGRPRNEPSDDDTSAYFEDGDGIIRAATRGRPRRGETRVELTAAQVAEKTEAGLLDDK